jgi:hypothetical protein
MSSSRPTALLLPLLLLLLLLSFLQDLDLEAEVEALSPADPPDCSMGMDTGHELIEPVRGLLQVPSSQALLDAVG